MIDLFISGAAGNQYCQYAFTRYLMKRREQLGISDSLRINWYVNTKANYSYPDSLEGMNTIEYYAKCRPLNGFYAQRFYIHACKLLRKKIDYNKLAKSGVYGYPNGIMCDEVSNKGHIVIQGNYEIPRYYDEVRNELLKELTPKDSVISKEAKDIREYVVKHNAICLSVRVFLDAVKNKRRKQLQPQYYYKAIDQIKNKLGGNGNYTFYVSSDNLEWCKNNLALDGEVIYDSSDFNIYEKIYIMTGCKYFVLSNSTFSWWIQYLCDYKDKIVVLPYCEGLGLFQWKDVPAGVYKDNWIMIDQNTEKEIKE